MTSLLAIPVLLWRGDVLPVRAGYALWASVLWLERAWRGRSSGWFTLTQAGVSVALLFGVHAIVEAQGWLGRPSLLDPRLWQVYGTTLACLVLVWVGLRRVEILRPLWSKDANSLDRIGTGGLVVGLFLLLVLLRRGRESPQNGIRLRVRGGTVVDAGGVRPRGLAVASRP